MSYASCRLRLGRANETTFPVLLTTSCSRRQALLGCDKAAKCVLDTARWLDSKDGCHLYVCTVMPDHVHLVLRSQDVPLSTLMESFKGYSARAVNKVSTRQGSVWQAGFHDALLTNKYAFERAIRYCLDNPVRAGLVRDWRDWPHSWCRWDP